MSLRDFYQQMPGGRPIMPQVIQAESVSSDWTAPLDIAELLSRVHPNGAPDTWVKFFAGEEITEQERGRVVTALRGYASPPESGTQGGEYIRVRNNTERDLRGYVWLDTDHDAIIAHTPEQLGAALSARSACEMKLRSINILLEQSAAAIRARIGHDSDLHLLWKLSDAIINAPAAFPDEHKHLLPPATVEMIERKRKYFEEKAEEARRAEETERNRQAEEREARSRERLAVVETATLDDLLDMLFANNRDSSIPAAFRARTLTAAQFELLLDLKDTGDPVARRGYARLIEIGAEILREIALKPPPTPEEIEAARQAKLQEQEEAKQREIAARIKALEEAQYPALCAEVKRLNLAPLEWVDLLPRVTDITRVTQFRQFFIEQTQRETDPLRKRVCELMARRIGSQSAPVTGAFLGIRG